MAEKETRELSRRVPQRPLSPFHEMERMERMFEDFFRRPFSLLTPSQWITGAQGWEEVAGPSVDVYEESDSIIVKAEIPGIRKEDIDVTFRENMLTVSGEKKKEEKVENKDYYRLERSYGSFSRSIPLPAEVETDKASASFKDGILEIRMPKTASSKEKVKKITVQ
ncbi:Hsp20/alpha crystallin family protein [Geotalea toluenoxydans]|uniref:Hsp20/alpha crystallin family protein n=1 Tax=Geotalea toluenoxydans TaxID=421624 RepID=UPI0006D01E8E|nr:Hsp20/alpha crystallin family protein [Geotalea toluenoxydans]